MLGKFFKVFLLKKMILFHVTYNLDPASLYSETLYLVNKLYLKN